MIIPIIIISQMLFAIFVLLKTVDGRYEDQKNRIAGCGLEHRFYVVEGLSLSSSQHNQTKRGITSAVLNAALVSTQLNAGFHVVRTRGLDHTVAFLAATHRQLENRFRMITTTKSLPPIQPGSACFTDLATFNTRWAKSRPTTLEQNLAEQLRQVPSCSVAAAVTLAKHFGSLATMMSKLAQMGENQAVKMMSKLRKGELRIGDKVAQNVYDVLVKEY
jgi:ERCC4-type nuclease